MSKKFKYGLITEKVSIFSGEYPVPVVDVFQTKKQRDAEYTRLINHYKTSKIRVRISKIKIFETTVTVRDALSNVCNAIFPNN